METRIRGRCDPLHRYREIIPDPADKLPCIAAFEENRHLGVNLGTEQNAKLAVREMNRDGMPHCRQRPKVAGAKRAKCCLAERKGSPSFCRNVDDLAAGVELTLQFVEKNAVIVGVADPMIEIRLYVEVTISGKSGFSMTVLNAERILSCVVPSAIW